MISDGRFSLYSAADWGKEKKKKKGSRHSQLRLMTRGSCSCGEDWDGTRGDPATSVVHQGQFFDRRVQQAEWGYARHAAHT